MLLVSLIDPVTATALFMHHHNVHAISILSLHYQSYFVSFAYPFDIHEYKNSQIYIQTRFCMKISYQKLIHYAAFYIGWFYILQGASRSISF